MSRETSGEHARELTVAAGQLGPVARDDSRGSVVERLIVLLRTAHRRGAQLVVLPELALTTFAGTGDQASV
jgi:N-carbamoyl-D-amino-acid hydrolase